MPQLDSLLEVGVEELPSSEIETLVNQLRRTLPKLLAKERLKYEAVKEFYSARRFGVIIYGLSEKQESFVEEKRGPSVAIAFKDGKPTKALEGFAKSNKASLEDIETRQDAGKEYVFLKRSVTGLAASIVLPAVYKELVESMEFKKPMRLPTVDARFVRPVRWVVAMLNDEILKLELLGKRSGHLSKGHRFLAGDVEVFPGSYFDRMREVFVIADHDERRQRVQKALQDLEKSLGVEIPVDAELTEDIVRLTEFPTPVLGAFDDKYLELPAEVVTISLKTHQRTFPVNIAGELSNRFVAFQDGKEDRKGNIREGYEEVINARLEDAHFYYFRDLAERLEDFVEKLKGIVFQAGLGTVYDKTSRTRTLAHLIAVLLKAAQREVEAIDRTALLCKADLATRMVQEFPELQGTMGRIYAEKSGETEEVSWGIQEHYANVAKRTGITGVVVSTADKIDTLVGNFIIGNVPTSSKDPYALKKKFDSVLRIAADFGWDLDLRQLFLKVAEMLKADPSGSSRSLYEFCENRFRFFLGSREYSLAVCKAVSPWWWNPFRGSEMAAAILRSDEEGILADLLVAFERVHNITRGHQDDTFDSRFFKDEAERRLLNSFVKVKERVLNALSRRLFDKAIEALRELKQPVDDYFDSVFVMDNQIDLRINRLGFLKSLDSLFSLVADFTPLLGTMKADEPSL